MDWCWWYSNGFLNPPPVSGTKARHTHSRLISLEHAVVCGCNLMRAQVWPINGDRDCTRISPSQHTGGRSSVCSLWPPQAKGHLSDLTDDHLLQFFTANSHILYTHSNTSLILKCPFKGIVHSKIKMSSFAHPLSHSNTSTFFILWNTK